MEWRLVRRHIVRAGHSEWRQLSNQKQLLQGFELWYLITLFLVHGIQKCQVRWENYELCVGKSLEVDCGGFFEGKLRTL